MRSALRCSLFVGSILWPFDLVAKELNLPRDEITAGRVVFLKMCARCHGTDASGGSAPDIQGMILKDVKDSARGVEAMPEIALSNEQAEQIAVYLMSLAPDQARLRLGIK